MKTKYVLDTNIFFNLEIKSGLGSSPKAIITSFTDAARSEAKNGAAEFFMPPSVLEEFQTFVEADEPYVRNFLSILTVKAPEYSKVSFESSLFHQLISETRHRLYRGLQIAEEELHNASKDFLSKADLNHIEYQKGVGDHLKKLRDRYRQATRYKFMDSTADMDIIVLAREIDGYIISTDEGLIHWARLFGAKEVLPQALKERFFHLQNLEEGTSKDQQDGR